eukprot:327896-Pelagomonas_calceolata.AAC.2
MQMLMQQQQANAERRHKANHQPPGQAGVKGCTEMSAPFTLSCRQSLSIHLWSSCTAACWAAIAQRLKRCFRLFVICTPGPLDAGLPRCWMDFKGCRSVMSMCKQYGVVHLLQILIRIQGFTDDLRLRLRDVWNTAATNAASVPQSSVSLYQSYFGVPFDSNLRAPVRNPRHMSLNLSGHVLSNVSRFRLRAHTLRVESTLLTEQFGLVVRSPLFVIDATCMRIKMKPMSSSSDGEKTARVNPDTGVKQPVS